MSSCYLCSSQADVNGQDYGRRKIVRCSECDYYEITNSAISMLQKDDFPEEWKAKLAETIKNENRSGKEPEIVIVNDAPTVQIKL